MIRDWMQATADLSALLVEFDHSRYRRPDDMTCDRYIDAVLVGLRVGVIYNPGAAFNRVTRDGWDGGGARDWCRKKSIRGTIEFLGPLMTEQVAFAFGSLMDVTSDWFSVRRGRVYNRERRPPSTAYLVRQLGGGWEFGPTHVRKGRTVVSWWMPRDPVSEVTYSAHVIDERGKPVQERSEYHETPRAALAALGDRLRKSYGFAKRDADELADALAVVESLPVAP